MKVRRCEENRKRGDRKGGRRRRGREEIEKGEEEEEEKREGGEGGEGAEVEVVEEEEGRGRGGRGGGEVNGIKVSNDRGGTIPVRRVVDVSSWRSGRFLVSASERERQPNRKLGQFPAARCHRRHIKVFPRSLVGGLVQVGTVKLHDITADLKVPYVQFCQTSCYQSS